MGPKPGRKAAALAITGLLVASFLVTTVLLSDAGASNATQAQLQTMVQAAQDSSSYASGLASIAVAHGLNVTAEQALIGSGDVLLTQAQVDLSSSSNFLAGIQAAGAAMKDYASASVGSSLALRSAGLTANVDIAALVDAEAEVNATVSFMARVVAQACLATSVASPNATLYQDSCAEARSDLDNATLDLSQAASVIAQLKANASAGVDVSQAAAIVAQAREDVNAAATELATISSFTYYQRGESYYNQVLLGLYANANASIAAQKNALDSLSGVQTSFGASAHSMTLSVANVSALAGAISSVDTASVMTAVSSSQSMVGEVDSNLTSLLSIVNGLGGSAALVSAIGTAQTGATAYSNALSSAKTATTDYNSASLSSFSSFVTNLDSAKGSVQSTGGTFAADYSSVQTQLSALITALGVLAPPALVAANSTFAALEVRVTSAAGSLNQALTTEAGEASSVQATIVSTTEGFFSSCCTEVNTSAVQEAVSVAATETTYLNQSSLAVVNSAASSIKSVANESISYVAQVNASLGGTVGGFQSSASALASAGASLESDAAATTTALAGATSVIGADVATRTSVRAAASAEVAIALSLFTNLQVSMGVSAMLAAGVDFQAAAASY